MSCVNGDSVVVEAFT